MKEYERATARVAPTEKDGTEQRAGGASPPLRRGETRKPPSVTSASRRDSSPQRGSQVAREGKRVRKEASGRPRGSPLRRGNGGNDRPSRATAPTGRAEKRRTGYYGPLYGRVQSSVSRKSLVESSPSRLNNFQAGAAESRRSMRKAIRRISSSVSGLQRNW